MKSTILILFLFVSLTYSWGQQSKIDSLLHIIETTKDDSVKYDLVNRIGFTYIFRFPEQFLPFVEKYLDEAIKDNSQVGVANIYNNLGIYYDVQGIRDSSSLYFNKALQFAKENNLHNVHSKALNNLGMFHWNKGEFDNAITYFFEALDLLNETEKDLATKEMFASKCLNNIGLIYQEMKLYRKAITTHLKALNLRLKYDIRSELPSSHTNLGICYRNLNQRDSAFYHLNQSLSIAREQGLFKEEKIAHDNLGNIYQDAGETNEAIYHYQSSLTIGEDLPNTANSDIITIGNLIRLYNDQQQWSKSISILDRAKIVLEQDPDAANFAIDLFKNGAIAYFKQGYIEEGQRYLDRFVQLKDSTFTRENADLLADYEAKYETQEKERALLVERSKSQELELQNLASEQEIIQQRNTIYLLIIAFLVLLLVGYLIYYSKKQRMREEKSLALLAAKEQNIKNVIEAQEQERERLARELHDGLVQEIRMLKTDLDSIELTSNLAKEKLEKRIANLKEDARDLAYAIMPVALRKAGLVEAINDLVQNSFISEPMKAQFYTQLDHIDVSEQLKTNIYRIIQESINNIIKHSGASSVDITMNQLNNMLIVTVEDDGKGFDTSSRKDSIGLKSMESRASIIGGVLDIDSGNDGTTITLRVKI